MMHKGNLADRGIRILMVGGGEAYHLEPLAECIKAADGEITLGVHGLFRVVGAGSREWLTEAASFDHVYQPTWPVVEETNSKWAAQAATANQQSLSRRSRQERPFLKLWLSLGKYLLRSRLSLRAYASEFSSLQEECDVLHLQSLFASEAMRWVAMGQLRRPLVVSCYGSDVFRLADPALNLLQQRVLDRAAVVTVSGPEFKEIILAKYGRHLAPKIQYAFYNPSTLPYVEADKKRARREREAAFPEVIGKKIVCLGHNGVPGNQHLELINSIGRLPDAVKAQCFLWVPMTYGGSPEYVETVKQALQANGLLAEISDSFLDRELLLEWKAASDILLYAPVSDAFSASVSQALASGSVGILGAWLPYKMRRKCGFEYVEIDDVNDAGDALKSTLEDWEGWEKKYRRNRELSEEVFALDQIGRGWVKVYREAASDRV